MRVRPTLALALMATLTLTPTLALAQAEGEGARPHRMTVVAPLANPLRPPAGADAPSPLPSAPLPRSAPVAALLNPLGAQAPQCRTQCAATRYACLAQEGDGLECNNNWNRCVLGCDGGAYRYSSTSPQVFTQGFAPR